MFCGSFWEGIENVLCLCGNRIVFGAGAGAGAGFRVWTNESPAF